MPVNIESISFTPELPASGTTDFLLGQILAKIVATITVKAEWIAEAGLTADGEDMILESTDNSITWNGGNFENEGFLQGDTIDLSGTSSNGTYTIATINGNVITVSGGSLSDETSETATIEGVNECTGVNFRYNLIENSDSENYNSLTDGNELKFSKGGIDYTDTSDISLIQQGVYASNRLGSATIKGSGDTLNRFIITHTFYVTPFFLIAHLSDIQNLKAPDYFFNFDCLKYIYNIELLYNISNPNKKQISNADSFQLGNTGWFNENFNGGIPAYTLDSISFSQGATALTYADYDGVTDVEIIISSVNSTFGALSSQFVLNHFILPEDESEYINTSTDQTTNFMFDRVKQLVGAAALNGDNYGTSKQVLKNVTATLLSSSQIKINAQIDLSSDYKTRISALTNKRFILSVTTQDPALDAENSDAVALLLEVSNYDTDLSNPSVGNVSTEFNYFPDTSVVSSDAGMFVEDTLKGNSIIGVDISDGALIKDITVEIYATKTTKDFTLEQKVFSFAGAIITGGVQQMNTSEPRGFVLKSDNPFYNITLDRRADLDSGSFKYYQLVYPFKIRWEDFIKLNGVDSDFYDSSELFNGYNNDWNRYFVASGWYLKYKITARIEENGYVNSIEKISNLYAYDYNDATDWTQTIKVFDIDTGLEIPDDVLSDKICRVQAIFTKVAGSLPDVADIEGMIEYEPYQEGGSNSIRNINTVYEHENGTPFISVLGTKLLKKEKASNVYTFTANIDGKLLTGSPKLSARIYDMTQPPFGTAKEFQDSDDFDFQDATDYDFQG